MNVCTTTTNDIPEMADEDNDYDNINPKRIKLSDVERISSSINDLNDDCLLGIFSYFSLNEILIVEKVCERWSELCQRSWKVVKGLEDRDGTCYLLDNPPFHRSIHHVRRINELPTVLKSCGHFITYYRHICNYSMFSDIFTARLRMALQHCDTLQDVEISHATYPLSSTDIYLLKCHCQNLERLIIGRIEKFAENDLCGLLSNNKKLTYFEFGANCCNTVTGEFLEHLPAGMQEIHLSRCEKLHQDLFISAIKKFKSLQCFSFNNKVYGPFADSIVKAVGELTTLTKLSMTYISSELKSAHRHLANLVNLKELYLNYNFGLDDISLISISDNCTQLKLLDIRGCPFVSNNGLNSLANLKKLEVLKMDMLDMVTDEAIGNLPTTLKDLVCNTCDNVRDRGVMKLLERTPNLTRLNLSYCSITKKTIEKAIEVIEKRTNGNTLEINVYGTDIDLSRIVELPSFLTVLDS